MARYYGAKAQDDHFIGTDRADYFYFDPSDLTSADSVVGGGGRRGDTLQFTTAGAIGVTALANVSQIERIVLADGPNSLILTDAFVSTADGARVRVVGGTGDDFIYASELTGPNAIDFVSGGGTDFVFGGSGDDSFEFAVASLDTSDRVNAGLGADRLILSGSGAVSTEQVAGFHGIDAITLGDGGIDITLSTGNIIASDGGFLLITGGAGADRIDASSIAYQYNSYSDTLALLGGAGDDVILGSPVDGQYVDGGAGADTIQAGRANVVYDAYDISTTVAGGFLLVDGAATIDLTRIDDQSVGDLNIVTGFSGVLVKSDSRESVTLTGSYGHYLAGGSGRDTITGGSTIHGGAGADTLVGNTTGTTFTLATGDFARGEIISGISANDTLDAFGMNDLRIGTVTGIDNLALGGFSDQTGSTLYVTASQVQDLRSLNGFNATLDITLQRGIDLLPLLQQNFGAKIDVTGTSSGDFISNFYLNNVHAGDGSDTIVSLGNSYEFGLLYGEAGDDEITTTISGGRIIDGGDGEDTLHLSSDYYNYFYEPNISIDLSNRQNQISYGSLTVRNFENIDISNLFSYYQYDITVHGDKNSNVIVGSDLADVIFGGRGDDVLTGNGGADTLYGGAGADIFRFVSHDTSNYPGFDTIVDFHLGEDKLEFDKSVYGVAGSAFNSRVLSDGSASIAGADLVIYTGGRLRSVDDVAGFLNGVASGPNDHGIFVAAKGDDGHTLLFYSATTHPFPYQIFEIADLGRIGDPAVTLNLTDFSFI